MNDRRVSSIRNRDFPLPWQTAVMILPPEFYRDDTVTLARKLLGTCLVHRTRQGRIAGRIVETEAYLRDDPACHAARGKTERNAAMFGPPGAAYVYLIYGMYHCFNVVTAPAGVGEAVLIRALEPLEGIELMQRRRGTENLHELCNGPGKLCDALDLTPKMNGVKLTRGALTLTDLPDKPGPDEIVATPRIGISVAVDLPLRFYIKGNHFASRRCIFLASRKVPRLRAKK